MYKTLEVQMKPQHIIIGYDQDFAKEINFALILKVHVTSSNLLFGLPQKKLYTDNPITSTNL